MSEMHRLVGWVQKLLSCMALQARSILFGRRPGIRILGTAAKGGTIGVLGIDLVAVLEHHQAALYP